MSSNKSFLKKKETGCVIRCHYCKDLGYTETYNVYDPEYVEIEPCPFCSEKKKDISNLN